MKFRFSLLICSMVSLLLVTSCKKGDTGPAGETGPAGPVGTPNVIYSDWFTPDLYTKDTIFGIWGFNYNKTAASLTQTVLDSGAVLTFGKLEGYNPLVWPTGQVGQLPISLTYVQGSTMTDNLSASATVGNLKIRFTNNLNFYSGISNLHKFRFIVIPGGKSGARFQSLTYSEICQKYNIPE